MHSIFINLITENGTLPRLKSYESTIIPNIGESIYMPHWGTYLIKDVVHYVFDDSDELGWIDIYVVKRK